MLRDGAMAAGCLFDPQLICETFLRGVEGILDAPQLGNNPFGRGRVRTRIDGRGACVVVDAQGEPVSEAERLAAFLAKN